MRLSRLHLLLLLFSLAACQSAPAHGDELLRVSLHAGLPELEKPGVPALSERIADAEDSPQRVLFDARDDRWIAIEGPLNSFRPADATGAHLKIDSSVERVVLTIWDWNNRPVYQWSQAAPVDRKFSFDIKGYGTYLLTVDGFKNEKCDYRLVRSVSLIESSLALGDPPRESDFFLGICAFPGRYHWKPGGKTVTPPRFDEESAVKVEAAAMSHLGLKVARLDVSMVLPEKADAPIDWKRMDAAVQAYREAKFKLALQVMHPPDWAIDAKYKGETKDKWRFPRREEPYRRYVREIVSRYGKHAKFVQVYNEPDQLEFWAAAPEEYIREFGWAKDEIRKVMKEVSITNGGYAFIDAKRSEYFTKELRGQTDLQAYHSHGNLNELIRDFDHMRQLHRDAGYEKPRYINTECGFAAWRLDQERNQAISLLQKIVYSWAHGDEGMLLFCSRMTKGPGRNDRDFGLLDYHFCPRFAFGAIAAFSRTYGGAKFERIISDKGKVHAYLFKRDGDFIVAVFAPETPGAITLESDAKDGESIDPMGNATKLGDAMNVRVGATPYLQTIVLKGATFVK